MKIRHILLLLVVGVSLLCSGCAPARSEMDYLLVGGRGEATGELRGMAFCALVEVGAGGAWARVEYLAPEALKGMVLTLEGEVCKVALGDLNYTCAATEVEGFLQPVSVFLIKETAATVQKEGEDTVLTFPGGSKLTLTPRGEPLAFEGEDISVRITWWQSGNAGAHSS